MSGRWRVLLVVTPSPPRGARLASSETLGLPPRDPALLAARLFRAGAEVRVADQRAEHLGAMRVRREAQLWRADLVLVYAGGSFVADNPVPDDRALRRLLGLSSWRAPVVACGPLAVRYGAELLERLPRLTGALLGDVHPSLVGAFRPGEVPGLLVRGGGPSPPPVAPGSGDREAPVLPAWHTLPLDAMAARAEGGVRVVDVLAGGLDPEAALAEVRHAVYRGGARRLAFVDRDLGADMEFTRELARGMFAAAPGLPWSCRVRADRLDARLALTLGNGGCQHVLVTSPAERDAAGLPPMDDPTRPRVESAVEAARVIGLNVRVEHVVGRAGHTPEILGAWQRWYKDRRVLVHAHVRVLHAGDRGAGEPRLDEAGKRAGLWDNALKPRDVERAVREVTVRERLLQEALES
jgi:hypothetical protein